MKTDAKELFEKYGPEYPDLGASVAKFRPAAAKQGVMAMQREQRLAYADAIERAIRSKQRASLRSEKPGRAIRCASGTAHNTGEEISRAIRAQHRAALAACPSQIRRAREPEEWVELYDAAMVETKKARAAARLAELQAVAA